MTVLEGIRKVIDLYHELSADNPLQAIRKRIILVKIKKVSLSSRQCFVLSPDKGLKNKQCTKLFAKAKKPDFMLLMKRYHPRNLSVVS